LRTKNKFSFDTKLKKEIEVEFALVEVEIVKCLQE